MAYLAASSLSWPLIRETIQLISKQSGHPSPRRRRGFPGWCWYWEGVGLAACVCSPDYPPPPDFLHQITSTSWTDLQILQNSTVLYQERSGRRTVSYKADTFNWPKWTLWTWWLATCKKLIAGSHDRSHWSNGSRQDSTVMIWKPPWYFGVWIQLLLSITSGPLV